MGSRDEKFSQFLRNTEHYHPRAAFLLLVLYLFLNNTINAASDWTEITRDPYSTTEMWEPYLWEYSSALATALLCIPLVFFIRKLDASSCGAKTWLLAHLLFATVFSIAHVALMVTFREISYLFFAKEYNFGPLWREFLYEYRKDIWGYATLISLYYILLFSYRRLIGEAAIINEHQASEVNKISESTTELPAHLLVKKLNKEFLVRLCDVYWIEASGNYVNLHTCDATFPLRYTMKQFCEQAHTKGFIRTHRSYAVQSNVIDNITFTDSGDGTVVLRNDIKIPISRRYKDALKARLSPVMAK